MTEKEKMKAGLWYDANNDQELIDQRLICRDLCFALNQLKPSDEKRNEVIENILVKEQAAKKAKALARSNIKDSKGISKDKTKKVPKGRKSIYIDDVKRGHKPLRKNRVNKHAR